jgi:LacI family transcriptional regulator
MVARHAGTSVSTVSLVVNGKDRGRVSAGLRDRVRAAVAELGYVVDQTASALARGRGDLVILFVPDPGNPFFAEVVRGARQVLDGRYRLLVATTRHGDQPTVDDVADHTSFRPAGMLVDAPVSGFMSSLPPEGLAPAVLLDAPDCPGSVNFDLQPGIRALVEHLAAAGHRRFGYLDTRAEVATYDVRRRLLRETAAAAGLTMVPRVVRAEVTVASAAREVGRQLPDWMSEGVTAVVAATDTMAYGVLAAARAADLVVPAQLAVADGLPADVGGPVRQRAGTPVRDPPAGSDRRESDSRGHVHRHGAGGPREHRRASGSDQRCGGRLTSGPAARARRGSPLSAGTTSL